MFYRYSEILFYRILHLYQTQLPLVHIFYQFFVKLSLGLTEIHHHEQVLYLQWKYHLS